MTHPAVPRPLRVLFVGYQDQDNLGLRYLMAVARAAGHEVGIETFAADPARLVARARAERPDVIGLSLIFQYMTPAFARVVAALRAAGVTAHVSVGGHYPSFEPDGTLAALPGADSVVRFEGEATMAALLARLAAGEDWRDLPGLAARLDDGQVKVNPLRPQVPDLDTIPWPLREDIPYESSDRPTAAILGSRGCPWNCDFCSIRPFYEAQEGSLRRLRSPADVVAEMRHLYHDRGVALFLFQDDDFLATGGRARAWAGEVADRIRDSDLAGQVAWKMSCRSDELRPDIVARLKAGGLTHVYMGVESGDPTGLKNMNKMLKPERHLEAGRILRAEGLSFDFGFMLLDPWSDFSQIANNIAFLDAFAGDGWSVAGFCRMLPYAGTPTARRLTSEGRLGGTAHEPDYRFLDPRLDRFHEWMIATFHRRNFTTEGLSHLLRAIIFESRLQPPALAWMTAEERRWLQHVSARANQAALVTLDLGLRHVAGCATPGDVLVSGGYLGDLTAREAAEEAALTRMLHAFWTDPDRQRRRQARLRAAQGPLPGGFDAAWTLAPGDAPGAWETRGLGVR
ncbi:MAG TPA: radical SAM protein [Paracoccaceae bacterium]|nr:radical SAM protein [Paracoccaceae bacterium]HMO72384.1 radical SAM protein [Paracoccaceae bacterium]